MQRLRYVPTRWRRAAAIRAAMGAPERAAQGDSGNVIFPRRKQGQHKKHGRKEGVVVTMEILETVYHMPLHKACTALVRHACG